MKLFGGEVEYREKFWAKKQQLSFYEGLGPEPMMASIKEGL